MVVGSQHEPVYPDADRIGQNHADGSLADLSVICNASHNDKPQNGLTPIVEKYAGREVAAIVDPGDVAFFGGHIIHRSLSNKTTDRYAARSSATTQRPLVHHVGLARPQSPANHLQILARGDTHLPFAEPTFGTPAPRTAGELRGAGCRPASGLMGDDGMMDMSRWSQLATIRRATETERATVGVLST